MPMKDMGLKKKNQMKNAYMDGGKTKYMGGGVMNQRPPMSQMFRGGGMTKDTTPSFQDEVQKMYGGGMTKKKLNYKDGGITKMQGGGHLLKENKRRYKKKELQAKLDENPRSTTTIGVRSKQRLDDKKPRGRKYSRSNAATKFAD